MSTVSLDSLSWIKTELERTLETARQRLDAFAEEPTQAELLAEFVERIHQVVGILTMVEVQGGRMLAEHMESLARAVQNKRLAVAHENLEPLMRGSLELTDYLDRMVSGMRDSPAVLLPITNEIRVRLGQTPLARERVGRSAQHEPRPVTATESAAALAARLRPQYQAALLAYYQGGDERSSIERMRKVIGALEAVATSPPVFEFLWVAGGVLEALADNGLSPTLAVKRLLGQVERELKRLATSSEAAMAEEPPDALLEQLLDEIDKASSGGERVAAIRTTFRLEEGSSDDPGPSARPGPGPGSALLRSVGTAILEDLGRVRDRIDIFVRTGRKNPGDLLPLADILKKVADALGMLGLSEPQARVVREHDAVKALAKETQSDDASLLRLATELIGIESDVEAFLVGSGEDPQTAALRGARVAGLREILADISRIKDAITEHVRNPGEAARLGELPRLADLLARTLDFLDLTSVAPLMHRIARYLEHLAQRETLPDRIELDRLADAVVSVEYYVETLQRGRPAPASMLENAARALAALGVREERGISASTPAGETASTTPAVQDHEPVPGPTKQPLPQQPVKPVLPQTAIPTGELPPVREEGADEEIVEVFLEEAAEVSETLAGVMPRWRDDPDDHEAVTTVRRSFHTLKGSGRMVGAKRLGEFAWSYENLLNRVIDRTLAPSESIISAVEAAVAAVPQLLAQFSMGEEPHVDTATLMAWAWRLARGEAVAEPMAAEPEAEVLDLESGSTGPQEAAAPEGEPIAGAEQPEILETHEVEASDGMGEPRLEPALYDIYRTEAEAHLSALRSWLAAVDRGEERGVTFELRRAVHTLRGSARMAGVSEMDSLFSPLDLLVKAADTDGRSLSALVQDIEIVTTLAQGIVEAYGDTGLEIPEWEPLRDRLAERAAHYGELSEDSLEEQAYTESLEEQAYTESLLGDNAVDESEAPAPVEGFGDDELGAPEASSSDGLGTSGDEAESVEKPVTSPVDENQSVAEPPATDQQAAQRSGARQTPVAATVDVRTIEGYDSELAEVFMGEAVELLEGADASVHAWVQNHDLTEPLTDLLRRLHTFKGGARMAGLTPPADLAHELEALLLRVSHGRVAVSGELLHVVERTLDRLHRMLEHVGSDGLVPVDTIMIAEVRRHAGVEESRSLDEEVNADHGFAAEFDEAPEGRLHAGDADNSAENIQEIPEEIEDDEDAAGPDRRRGPRLRHEMARVRADLLESSINNAGEVSIYRSRIEQQLLGMNVHLTELDRTVERVRNQLRELEIETEAQILADHRTEETSGDFDPLEFDRYTRIHELSRSLAEAVSDLTSLRSLFATELRQTGVLLERQGRVNVELQDALMRTRMIPFALSGTRLRRVVRQVAEETGKNAELRLNGVEGEMDRQVLEHILPAIEHLLRNAVVHGIEAPEVRGSRGKPPVGRINLALRREGGEVIIEVADDGGGLDLKAIRAKAEREGIINAGAVLTDQEVAELVFRPGFSTADRVTQAAGRGVGMDVVAAEARQVGGSAEIESRPFEGTLCRMRLPATLAITQTLLVRVGRTRYPVPLTSISGVQRLPRVELDELLDAEEPLFEYAGEVYDVISLAQVLGEPAAGIEEEVPRIPLLLVNAGGRRVALIADDMEGSREVVVKSVGPQIGHVPGIAGATIFGDGSIGLLLDLSALVRAMPQAEAVEAQPAAVFAHAGEQAPLIMVVDDSITVRRVTRRLLERRGARVLTAKDGVEALEQLQDHKPDVLLLDIEMPRMDGYELAGHMKNDERMRTIPIIVITSRTGDKHRARGEQIGIERYLGKPYQEAELLEAIKEIVVGFDPQGTRAIDTHVDLDLRSD